MRWFAGVLACAMACVPAWVSAAPPRALELQDLGAPAFTTFSARDGLPETVTTDTATDRDGFVWAATPVGPYRYDGHRWTAPREAGMRQFVDDLYIDGDGTLWAALRSAGIARHDGVRWHRQHAGLPSTQVRRIGEALDADGQRVLWALTWDRGVMQRRDGRWIADPDNATLPRDGVLSMAQTRDARGRLRDWLGAGSQGLWFRDVGTRGWRRWEAPGFVAGQVEYLLASPSARGDALWISAFGTGLWRLDADGLRHWSRETGELPSNDLYGIVRMRQGQGADAIWVASRSGLVRVHRDRAQVFDRRHGLPSNAVRGLSVWQAPGGAQVLWLATEAGVARTIPGASAWTTASLLGATSTGVFATLVEPDGHGGERLWVGASEDGLGVYEAGRWRVYTAAAGELAEGGVSMIRATTARDGSRTRWIGQWAGALLRVREDAQGLAFERQRTPWAATPGNAVLDVLLRQVDGSPEFWVGTRLTGAWRLRDGAWSRAALPGASDPMRVGRLQLQRARGGREWVWASTDRGLARYDGTRWALFGREFGLPSTQLIGAQLHEESGGRQVLWLGSSDAGVVRVDVTDPLRPALVRELLPAPPDSTVYSALRDSAGRVYVCTNNGVQQLARAAGGWRARVFTRRDGMVHDECNTNAQFIDAHDRFWTGTLGGLTVYDPADAVRDAHAKPLRLVGMRIDGAPVAGMALDVPAGARAVEVDYALLSWQREGESRFRTQLLGHEPEPSPWSAQATRTFGALPPGDYVLRIQARDYAGNASTPLEVALHVQSRWWQAPWAAALGVATLLLLGYGLALLRTRSVHARRRALERRVAERTADLNHANARLVDLSYRDALTGLANRRRLLETLDALVGDLRPAALAVFDVDHFKAYNDRHGHPAGDEALRGMAASLAACAPAGALVARHGGEEFAVLLPETGAAAAAALAEAVRADLEARDIPVPGTDAVERIAVSAGVASVLLQHPEDAHRLLREADLALYAAKRDGRNRVRVHDGRGAPG